MVIHIPSGAGPADTTRSPHARLQTLGGKNVTLNAGFWAEKGAVNRTISLRHGFEMLDRAGNFHNLRLAAGAIEGSYRGRNFLDSDVYKWLEAVAWELGNRPDAELQGMADHAIALIAAAQRADGYINSYYQTAGPDAAWQDMDHGHELYCAGHLFQAAIAFRRAGGDSRLLEIACRFADHICSTFGPDKRQETCGHPEIEMALIELYRATSDEHYLEMASFFIGQRGKRRMAGYSSYGPEYHQDHVPVREVIEAAGHTVRQLYLASGVTDLYLETGEQGLLDAMLRLWQDIVSTKLYITGGLGSRFDGEAFGDPYELPTDQCYCEACSSIASFMWNWRLLLATGEARFADQMELALYNSILASPALDGRHYFYINPLMLRAARFLRLSSNPPPGEEFRPTERPEWHDVACCPPNVMRLLASLPQYLATRDAAGVQIHHYAAADLTGELAPGQRVGLRLITDYPWSGRIRLEIAETGGSAWELRLRLPEWSSAATLAINGQEVGALTVRQGYAVLERAWRPGDTVDLSLGMEPMLVAANPRIDATRASLAIQRGPIIYCLEDCDQEVQGGLLDVEIDASQPLGVRWQEALLGGAMVVDAAGQYRRTETWGHRLYQPVASLHPPAARPARLVAVPYYAWANRGIGAMRVWVPRAGSV
jgi:DUF1680 family protein